MNVDAALKTELDERLKPFGQQHVLAFWDELSGQQQLALAEQIRGLDLALIDRLYHDSPSSENAAELAARAEPPPAIRLNSPDNPIDAEAARERGRTALAQGKLGMVIVAGGQGTRLGFDHPKGMYGIGPVSEVTLYQILCEKAGAVARRYGVKVPLYLMTSPATHEETVEFLSRNEYFGLNADDVNIFCQGTMPAVDIETGQLILAGKDKLFLSPDGHGGMLEAMRRSGVLADVERRDLENLFYMQVDNPLVKAGDAAFLGYHLLSRSEVSTQVVAKVDPLERVGNVVSVDGKVRIIEYSDLPNEAARRRQADGSLALWAGSIAVHLFDVAFLRRVVENPDMLPFHVARKKVPYIDANGRPVEPSEPNAIKFERFIFDLLPAASRSIVVEVDPREAFAPLKNAPGAERDSPEAVRRQMVALHREWLEEAGAEVAPGVEVEISPAFALDAEELAAKIQPGLRITAPRYFGAS